jgi:hypothetical protein
MTAVGKRFDALCRRRCIGNVQRAAGSRLKPGAAAASSVAHCLSNLRDPHPLNGEFAYGGCLRPWRKAQPSAAMPMREITYC